MIAAIVAQLRLEGVQIDAAGGVGRDGVHGEAAGCGSRRIGAMGGFRDQHAAAMAGASITVLDGRANSGHAA
jgi:hypothetical protein